MTDEKWTCRLCTHPNLEELCGYCGYPRSEQWRLPPLATGFRPAARNGNSRVRRYVLSLARSEESG